MGNFLNYDNSLFQFINRLIDMILLSLLWCICSLPIFTIGASTTALYTVTLKMAKDQEGYLFRSYFKAFVSNFKQSTIIWLILLVIGSILTFGLFFWFGMTSLIANVFGFIMAFVTVLFSFILLYSFPLLAKFNNTVKQTIKNALLIALTNLKNTIIILLFTALSVAFIVFVKAGPFIFVLFGFSFLAYVNSFFFNKVFKQYLTEEDEDDMLN